MAVRALASVFSDQRREVHQLVAEDDVVAAHLTHHGRQTGDLMGIPPTGVAGQVIGASFNRIADGRIVERWGNSDDLGLLQQLGVIPRA